MQRYYSSVEFGPGLTHFKSQLQGKPFSFLSLSTPLPLSPDVPFLSSNFFFSLLSAFWTYFSSSKSLTGFLIKDSINLVLGYPFFMASHTILWFRLSTQMTSILNLSTQLLRDSSSPCINFLRLDDNFLGGEGKEGNTCDESLFKGVS